MQGNWFKGLRRWCTGTCVVLALGGGLARAGDNDADLKQMLEQQSKQIEELRKRLDAAEAAKATHPVSAQLAAPSEAASGTDPIKTIVDSYLKEKDDQKKAEDEAKKAHGDPDSYVVGSNLGMTVKWETISDREGNERGGNVQAQQGPRLSTTDGDFTVHFGFRFQYDVVAWDQSPVSRLPSQLGDFEDGTYFRRLRPYFDGRVWQVVEFTTEMQLEQVRQGIVQLDEVFAGLMDIPYIGTIRVGHMRIPHGLEGDMVSSSKVMTFMEKSSMTDAIFMNQNFAPGIWTGNSVMDQRLTWAGMIYRQELDLHDSIGADFGDGNYAATGRITCLPLYVDDGRYLVHLGASATWAKSEKTDPTGALTTGATAGALTDPTLTAGLVGPGVVRFRARPEQRDASGDYGNDILGANGLVTALPGNGNRMVDTGNIAASGVSIIAGEFLSILGPFSLQAEYGIATSLDSQVSLNPFNAAIPAAPLQHVGNLSFSGGYAQVSYILTGENRLYDKRLGRLASNYLDQNSNFWFTETDNGRWSLGRGAWEVAARYSYLNLNDGPVQGGVMTGLSLGLNWYINPNLKVQFEYIHDERYDRLSGNPVSLGTILSTGSPGNLPASVDGFGMRTQFFF